MRFLDNDEIKDGTMCWIGVALEWLDVIQFQNVQGELRAWFRQHRLTADGFREKGFALSPIPYPSYLPNEMIEKESKSGS